MPMSRSPKKQNTCAALYSAGTGCSKPVEGVRWCSCHNEERVKLYLSYKAHEALLQGLSDIPPCHDVMTVTACDNLPLLREWNKHLLKKFNLLTRCIEARVYFTRRFFGEDMDFGHKTRWDNLVQKRSEVDQLMSQIETRGCQLIFRSQDAMWAFEKDTNVTEDISVSCPEEPARDMGAVILSIHSTDGVECNTIEDPLEAILRQKAYELKEKIRMHLASYCAPSTSRFHRERLEVIYAYVRRAVYQDPSLMFLSHSYDSVMALLSDPDLDLVTVEKLWRAISALCIHDVQSAVDDVVRSADGEHVVVLGGKIFKNLSGERWPLHVWAHMMAIRQCYACLRRTCRTIDEVIDLTRCALLTQVPLSQTYLKYDFNIDGSRELLLAGFVTNDIPLSSPRHSIVSKELDSKHSWEESLWNLYLYASLSLNDPMAQPFVNSCIRHPDFMVILRKGADARVIRSKPVVWTTRKRFAESRAALASVPWEGKARVINLSDLALEDARPSGWGDQKISDCMQVIVVDSSDSTMGDFVRKLVQIWCQVYEVGNKSKLYDVLKGPYEAAGELEEFKVVKPKIALEYYQRLWGCMPPPAVVKDPASFLP